MIKDTYNVCSITKQCTKCEQTKPLTEFYTYSKLKNGHRTAISKDGYRSMCKICWATYSFKYSQTRRGKKNRTKALYRWNIEKYGISIAEYDKMFEAQNGVCVICELPEITRRLSIDHNHQTGEVRGLLCSRCNILVGIIEGSSEVLPKATEYVNKHSFNKV